MEKGMGLEYFSTWVKWDMRDNTRMISNKEKEQYI